MLVTDIITNARDAAVDAALSKEETTDIKNAFKEVIRKYKSDEGLAELVGIFDPAGE